MYRGDSGGGVVVCFRARIRCVCFYFCNFHMCVACIVVIQAVELWLFSGLRIRCVFFCNFHLGVACIVVIQAVELWLFSGSRIRCVYFFFVIFTWVYHV